MEIEKKLVIDEYCKKKEIKEFLDYASSKLVTPFDFTNPISDEDMSFSDNPIRNLMSKKGGIWKHNFYEYLRNKSHKIIEECLKYGKVYVDILWDGETVDLIIEDVKTDRNVEVDFKESYLENIIGPYNTLNLLKSNASITENRILNENLREKAYSHNIDAFSEFKKERFQRNAKGQIGYLGYLVQKVITSGL
jgi:hypothetical protein